MLKTVVSRLRHTTTRGGYSLFASSSHFVQKSISKDVESTTRVELPAAMFHDAPMPKMEVFDRNIKHAQKERAGKMGPEGRMFDYLRDEIASDLVDRLMYIRRDFPVAADLGAGSGHILKQMAAKNYFAGIKRLFMTDYSEAMLTRDGNFEDELLKDRKMKVHKMVVDEEYLPFAPGKLDLVMSSGSLHWINNLPGTLNSIKTALKPDGCFVAALIGGDTLMELRSAFIIAEQEREGGVSPHISPMAGVRDAGNLLTRIGFALPTVDSTRYTIYYPDAFSLMHHLQFMGENNAQSSRK
eukprot:GEZU01008715.1.p1 GENE.GEZU01008715.1~~GEZU01008715.1.p1  ORF type:complete len:298 (-),score=54.53 GEZU01008715.1:78-971(-)